MIDVSSWTREEATAFLKRAGLLKRTRVIEGDERERVFTMLALVPSTESNNQRFWTETWVVGDITYDHTTGEGIDELTETLKDE